MGPAAGRENFMYSFFSSTVRSKASNGAWLPCDLSRAMICHWGFFRALFVSFRRLLAASPCAIINLFISVARASSTSACRPSLWYSSTNTLRVFFFKRAARSASAWDYESHQMRVEGCEPRVPAGSLEGIWMGGDLQPAVSFLAPCPPSDCLPVQGR